MGSKPIHTHSYNLYIRDQRRVIYSVWLSINLLRFSLFFCYCRGTLDYFYEMEMEKFDMKLTLNVLY